MGGLVVARVRGEPTEDLLRECQEQVLFLGRDAGRGKVLDDTLEMEAWPGLRSARARDRFYKRPARRPRI
jgi:hypothetical protein